MFLAKQVHHHSPQDGERAKKMTKRQIKVIVSQLGIDAHDRGMLIVSRALRDAGMEVVYLGANNTVEQIVRVAVQEDADVVGVSSHGESHLVLAPKLVRRLKEEGLADVLVVLGGLILADDIPIMKKAGISEVFTEGAKLDDIVKYIEDNVGKRRRTASTI